MYKKPSKRKKKILPGKPNLTPLLDAIFIFIFFLLFSSDLKQIFEIPIDVPIISESDSTKSDEEPLGLTLQLKESSLTLLSLLVYVLYSIVVAKRKIAIWITSIFFLRLVT